MTDRAALYLRVSSQRQAGDDRASLSVQLEQCTRYAQERGWQVVATAEDHESGKNVSRAGYQRLLEMARSGRIDYIIVFAPERFGRKAWEVLARREEMDELGVEVHATTRPVADWLSMAINAVIGENELKVIQSRIAPAKRAKAEQGYYVGSRVPFGLERERTRQGSILRPGPRFDILKLAFQYAAGGATLNEIARRVGALIDPDVIDPTAVRFMLLNPVYAGRCRWQEIDVAAQWQPMIDPDLFRKAGEALHARYRQRRPLGAAMPYWIVGLARCGHCGARMTHHTTTNRHGKRYVYLYCNRRNRGPVADGCERKALVALHAVQDEVLRQVSGVWVSAGDVIGRLEAYAAARRAVTLERIATIGAERERLKQRVRRAQADRLDDPDAFSLADVAQIRRSAEDGIAAHEDELATLERSLASSEDYEGLRELLESDAWLESRHTDPARFRAFLSRFVKQVDVYDTKHIEAVWLPALERVATR